MLAYARGVVAGEIVAGHYVRLACQRHLDDLEKGAARGLVFRPDRAEAIIYFAEHVVCLAEDQPLRLDDFQVFILGSLFGWYRHAETRDQGLETKDQGPAIEQTRGSAARRVEEGPALHRRFRYAYVEIGKGNGKTPLAAVIALYGLVMDKETAPEIYSAAVDHDQAKKCFDDAAMMVAASPELRKRVHAQVGSLSVPSRFASFRPLSSEHRSFHGQRVHIGIIDELHAHPDDKVSSAIRAGTKRRQNALILEITNAPFGSTSVCTKHHDSSVKILEGITPNDAWFAYIATLDPCPACREKGLEQPDEKCPHCDDWRDPRFWKKANPGLGSILPESYLREQVGIAQTVTSEENLVKRLNFCLRTEQAVRWLNMQRWDACGRIPVDFEKLAVERRPAIGGLDLATTTDFAAFDLCFESEKAGAGRALKPFLFLPKATIEQRIEATGIRFDEWAKKGLLHLTEGDMIDFEYIRATIVAAQKKWNFTRINYDRRNADWIIPALMKDGFEMVPFNQSIVGYNGPTRAFERLVLGGKLLHGGHEVLRWMASNATTVTDSTGNVKPDKEKSGDKIDGITAAVMALGGWIDEPHEEGGDAGVFFL